VRPITTMTDGQFEALRLLDLVLVKTVMSGDLHVRDDAGTDWLLTPAGDLEAFDLQRHPREPA
jgi:hypothetical protein